MEVGFYLAFYGPAKTWKVTYYPNDKEAAYKAVSSYSLKINLEKNEEILDVLCYCGYSLLCDSNGEELEYITTNILKSVEDEYKKIRR